MKFSFHLIMLSFIIFQYYGCTENETVGLQQENIKPFMAAKNKYVFIEKKDGLLGKGVAYSLMFLDLKNEKRGKIVDHLPYNSEVSVSPNSRYIAHFVDEEVFHKGLIKIYDLKSAKSRILNIESSISDINPLSKTKFNNLEFLNDSVLIFSLYPGLVYKYIIPTDSVKLLKNFGQNYILAMKTSPKKNYIAVSMQNLEEWDKTNILKPRLMFYNILKDTILVQTNIYPLFLKNWTSDGRYFCYEDTLSNYYDINERKIVKLNDSKIELLVSPNLYCKIEWGIEKKEYHINLYNMSLQQNIMIYSTPNDISELAYLK